MAVIRVKWEGQSGTDPNVENFVIRPDIHLFNYMFMARVKKLFENKIIYIRIACIYPFYIFRSH
jgi:hypothetical protein